MILTEVVSSGSNGNVAKGCWMSGPPEEAAEALSIACAEVQRMRPREGVAIIIRRAP